MVCLFLLIITIFYLRSCNCCLVSYTMKEPALCITALVLDLH